MSNVKLYAVESIVAYESPSYQFVYLDIAAAKEKFDELVAVEQAEKKSYNYITLVEFPLGGDMVCDRKEIIEWHPSKRTVTKAA